MAACREPAFLMSVPVCASVISCGGCGVLLISPSTGVSGGLLRDCGISWVSAFKIWMLFDIFFTS